MYGKLKISELQPETHSTENEIDNILALFGNKFGKYQLKNSIFVCIPVIFSCMYMLTYIFTSRNLDYRCKIDDCDGAQPVYNPSWLQNAVPYDKNKPSQCKKFLKISNYSTCSSETFNRSHEEICTEFVFATDATSILNDFSLECDDNLWKLTIVGTISGCGQLIALPITGYISDKFGRRIIVLGGLIISSILGNLRSMSTSYPWFLAFEFLDQLSGSSAFTSGLVLGAELVSPEKRTLMCTLIYICFPIAEITLGIVAWLTRSWRLLLRCIYVPSFFLIFFFWFTPESLTWLLSKGKIEKVKAMFQNAAVANNIQLSEETLSKLRLNTPLNKNIKESTGDDSILLILKSPILLFRLINCCFCCLSINLIYFGLVLKSVGLGGNEYLNFILLALPEIPAFIVTCFLVQKLGRKLILFISFCVTGATCIAFIFVSDILWIQLVTFLIGKFSISAAFAVACIISTEIFPTSLRNSAVGFVLTAGMIGAIAAPQMALVAQIHESLPFIIFSGLSIISALLSLLFPETLNKRLPNTVEEAKNIGKKQNRIDPLPIITKFDAYVNHL